MKPRFLLRLPGVTPHAAAPRSARPTSREVSRRMALVKRGGTAPELEVRRLARAAGLSFRTCAPELPGRPDLANAKRRWAVFVHGCFWHAHLACGRGRVPRSNASYWSAKLEDNRRRDGRKVAQLVRAGFRVLTIWECELAHRDAVLARLARLACRGRRRRTSAVARGLTGGDR